MPPGRVHHHPALQDESLRTSSFRALTDPKLFDMVESVLAPISAADDTYSFTLRRNDATHIKYGEGGFFKRHADYLSLTSNVVEEFTFIICVTPEEIAATTEGGETIIHAFQHSKKFAATTTPRQAGCRHVCGGRC